VADTLLTPLLAVPRAGMSREEAERNLRILAGQQTPAAPDSEPLPLAPAEPPPPLPAPVPVAALTAAALRSLVESVPDALVIADADGRIVLVNAQTEQLFGYPRGELLGHAVELLVPERQRARHVAQRAAFARDPHVRPMGRGLPLTGRRKDGHEIPVEISLSPLTTDAGLLIVSSIRDVTERRKAETQLQTMEKRYRTLVEGIPAVTFLAAMDESANELYVSPYIEKLLGFTQEEWLENPILWYTQLHPDDAARWHEEFARTVATGDTFQSVYRFIAKPDPARPGNPRVVWVHGEARMVRDAAGRPLFLQGVAFDITPMKEAEEELKALNASLEQRVAERTAEVEAQARELVRSNRDLMLFAGVAAHDLKAPLRTMTGQIQELDKKYRDRFDPGDREAFITPSFTSAGGMEKLIEGLLEFSKVRTEGKEPAPTSCADVVAEACRLLQGDIDRLGATVDRGELPVVLADAQQLVRLLQNLISNSLKFRADDRLPRVRVAARREGAEWIIEVSDNGIGIEGLKGRRLTKVKDPLEKIFDLGVESRQHSGKKYGDKYPGSGIGLSTCKNIVERHGGRIWASSDGHDKGTTIFFTLPAAD
jgi:PAS domain S-box-containing protein